MVKKILFLPVVLLISLAAYAQETTKDDVAAIYSYMKTGDYLSALEVCETQLEGNPDDTKLLSLRGLVHAYMGEQDKALADADKVLDTDAKNSVAHWAKGEVFYINKNYSAALASYDKAISYDKKLAGPCAGKIRTLMAMKEDKEVVKNLDAYLHTHPSSGELLFLRGQVYFQNKKYVQAIEEYDKALKKEPDWDAARVYVNRGLAYNALQKYTEAMDDFSRAIKANPNSMSGYLARGTLKYEQKQYAESVEDFKKADVLDPNNNIIIYNIGMAYLRSDRKQDACRSFQKACAGGNPNACAALLTQCSDMQSN